MKFWELAHPPGKILDPPLDAFLNSIVSPDATILLTENASGNNERMTIASRDTIEFPQCASFHKVNCCSEVHIIMPH